MGCLDGNAQEMLGDDPIGHIISRSSRVDHPSAQPWFTQWL